MVIHKGKFVYKNGERLGVLRPMNEEEAQLSIDEATRIKREQEAGTLSEEEALKQFNKILSDRQFVFVGLVGLDGDVLDPRDGTSLGKLQPGDSFVPESELGNCREVAQA